MMIVPYDPRWPAEFEAERDRIQMALGALALRIDHHGSTAVPGLAAKPIIDIQVSVERLHPIEAVRGPLSSVLVTGTLPHPTMRSVPSSIGRTIGRTRITSTSSRPAATKSDARSRSATICEPHVEAAREYEALKQHLAGQFGGESFASRQGYADAKSDFIDRVVRLALG